MPEITVNRDGPYIISVDDLTIKSGDGKELELPQGSAVALCRCGHSASKPFCDGSHKTAGFEHDPSA